MTTKHEKTDKRRFSVALSFAGEHRSFVSKVADAVAQHLPRERIFYDNDYRAELARPNLDTYLQSIYHDQSELIVIFLCADYEHKEWCGLEWRALRDLIKKKRDDQIMPFRLDKTEIPGLFSIDGYISIDGKTTPTEVAALILERLGNKVVSTTPASQPFLKSSGNWVFLGSNFFEASSVKSLTTPRNSIEIRIKTTESREDAIMAMLKPGQFQRPAIPYAHKDDAWFVNVSSAECVSESEENIWTLTLQFSPEHHGSSFMTEIGTTGRSADDIARLRAGRILLNDPSPRNATRIAPQDSMVESLVVGLNARLKADHCPIVTLLTPGPAT